MKNLFNIILVTLLLSFSVSYLVGQSGPQVKFDAKITSVEESGDKLESVTVVVTIGSDTLEKVIAQNGRMFFQLDTGNVYKIEFSKSGYVSKHLLVSTVNAPENVKSNSSLKVEVSLFLSKEGLNVDFLKTKPMGVARYNYMTEKLHWDDDYTRSIVELIITATLENYKENNSDE